MRVALRGTHPGCVERRPEFDERCEFDGRFSVARLSRRGDYALYARANMVSDTDGRGHFGGRHVQVAFFSHGQSSSSSTGGDDSSSQQWRAFRPVSFVGYYPPLPSRDDNVYFAAVKRNPVDATSLLGLFPVVSRRAFSNANHAAIAMAVSWDAVHFSSLERFFDSQDAGGGRSFDHPVDGWIVEDDDVVHFFIQTNVPGISLDLTPALLLQRSHRRRSLAEDSIAQEKPTAIVRRSVPLGALRNLTARARRELSSSSLL